MLNAIGDRMIELSNIGMATAFVAGIVSFLSPCVLPLVPGYVSYVAGSSFSERTAPSLSLRLRAGGLSTCFILGFSTIFVLLGASATALGQVLLSYRDELNLVGGVTVVGFGLLTLGIFRTSWLQRDYRIRWDAPGRGPIAAYVLGLAFGFGWTPCIGPILGSILTMSAASSSVTSGIALLAIYSLGLGVPFLLAAIFTAGLLSRIRSFSLFGRALKTLAGLTMIAMGVAMTTGHLSTFSYWLIDVLPVLSTIG